MTRRFISRSLWRKLAATALASAVFVLLYEVTMFDSREAAPSGVVDPTLPAAGSRIMFTATAYCKGRTTASGVGVRTGIAASDPSILPVGSVVNIATDTAKYNGVYTIMDTGPRVQGRLVDIYMWSCREALAFGRRPVEVTVLRLGWNPSASTPSLVDRLFRRREAARRAPPARPAPPATTGVDDAGGAQAVPGSATPGNAPGDDAAARPVDPSPLAPSNAPSSLAPPPDVPGLPSP
jgi:3D (Asp-Asp-Asp) domain-containing protein